MKSRFLVPILVISIVATIIIPVFTFLFVYPSFAKLQAQLTEDEAERIGVHLAGSLLSSGSALSRETLSDASVGHLQTALRAFRLDKIRVFSPSGEIIYSSDPKEIGEINQHSYFHQIVAMGSIYSKIARKSARSLEGSLMTADVVETYVPIMKNGAFMGAFEIYMDITRQMARQTRLISIFYGVSLSVMVVLLGGVIIIYLRARTYIQERNRAEEQVHQAMRDWEDTFNTITDMITIHDRDFNIIKANIAARKAFGSEETTPVLAKCYACYHGTTQPPEGCASCTSLKTGEPSLFEVYEPHLQKFIEIRAIPRFDKDGALFGLIHIVRDITGRKRNEEERDRLIARLQKALAEIKTLSGLLPICAHCKKIRDEKGYWSQIEAYIRDHTDAEFSHGICEECLARNYPMTAKRMKDEAGDKSLEPGSSGEKEQT